MTEKDLQNSGSAEHDKDCDCEHDDCNCNTVTLEMEDGTTQDFMVLDIIEHDGNRYIALAEVDSMEYDIMGFKEVGENVELTVIEEDEEFDMVAKLFEEHFAQADDEDDDEDDEEEE